MVSCCFHSQVNTYDISYFIVDGELHTTRSCTNQKKEQNLCADYQEPSLKKCTVCDTDYCNE